VLEVFLTSLVNVFSPAQLVPMSIGVFVGIVGAAIPGITVTMTVILVLPFTFGMTTLQGLTTMTGVYIGGMSGGLISACLLGIPGTPSSIATTFDGFPMARRGEQGRALWLGIWSSFIGGLIAGAFLVVGAVQLAEFALKFGPWEFFALFILALSIVASLSETSLIKGLIAGMFGLLVTTVGTDPLMGRERLTFGVEMFIGGFSFLPILIGVYGVSQLMKDVEQLQSGAGPKIDLKARLAVSHLAVLKEIFRHWGNLIRSSLIGVWIGVLPAVGGSAANIMAWDQAKKASKYPEKFGTGIADGIIATESANNANVGGSLITIMAFGIPGDAVTAVMLGAMIIHGIIPGPVFITDHAEIAYGVFAAYFVAHFVMVLMQWLGARVFIRLVNLPRHILIPHVLVFCVVGSFALNNVMADVWILFFFGILGYLMVKYGFPLAPLILGVILGDLIEINFVRSIQTDPSYTQFFTRPISLILLLLSVVSIAIAVYQMRAQKRRGLVGVGKEF
jgi:putative tricarboxylic transport membrane protein